MSRTITLASPAKINLILRVLRKRADGYHDISSLMQSLTLRDAITVGVGDGEGISLECNSTAVPTGNTNLAFRGAEEFIRAAGIKRKVSITITKNIPVGAGLGGGSSNAATVISGLNTLFRTGMNAGELMRIGAAIGSDVPFFLLGASAIATGRGEVLQAVALPHYGYVLVNPGFEVSTAWAYKNLDLTNTLQDYILTYSCEVFENPGKLASCMVNDLEASTLRQHPEITAIKDAVVKTGAIKALMSGSGPTVFGIFSGMAEAEEAANALRQTLDPRYFVCAAEGL